MKLSRTVAYATQAVLQLAAADAGVPVPCSRMAAEGKMPERFLLQILRRLVTHGLLDSTRGVDGGYSLARRPDQITLLDIIEAIEGPLTSGMPTGQGVSLSTLARLRSVCDRIVETARAELSAARVSDLLGESKKPPGRNPRRGSS